MPLSSPAWNWGRRHWRSLLLLALLLAVVARAPDLLTNPRFWAEEGTIAFSTAWSQPWYSALAHPTQDFYYLTINLAALLAARLFPLEYAPLVTTSIALALQMLLFWYIIFCLEGTLSRTQQIVLVAVVLFVGTTGPVWLTTTASQFHFTVLAFLILLRDDQSSGRRCSRTDTVLLVLGGLTGPASNLLLPAFVVSWWHTRGRRECLLAATLAATASVQIVFFLVNADIGAARLEPSDLSDGTVEHWFRQFLFWSFLGKELVAATSSYPELLRGVSAGLVGASIAVAVVFSSAYRTRLATFAFFLFSWGALLGSPGMEGGWRYVYPAAVMLLTIFVLAGHDRAPPTVRGVAAGVLSISLIAWASSYRGQLRPWVAKERPAWRQEVAKWQKDPSYQLKISPQWERSQWTVELETKGAGGEE